MAESTAIRDLMRQDDKMAALLTQLEAVGAPEQPVWYPSVQEATELMALLGVPPEDMPDTIAARTLVFDNPEAVWLLERHVEGLRRIVGQFEPDIHFFGLPEATGALARFFYVYVCLAAFPNARAYHQSLGIPDDISIATLADMGRNMRVHRKRTGLSGLAAPYWQNLHLRGLIYQLGRLQFERTTLNAAMAESIRAAGQDANEGDAALSLHIPDFMGGFPPSSIENSLAQARDFFSRFSPEWPVQYGVCFSWLLDNQLPEHLPSQSNIVQFQRRFHLVDQGGRDSRSVALFVWGRADMPAELSADASSLERALIGHTQAGGAWGWGSGWLTL